MVFLLEHAAVLLACPVFKADPFICALESNRKNVTEWWKVTYRKYVYINDHTGVLGKGKQHLKITCVWTITINKLQYVLIIYSCPFWPEFTQLCFVIVLIRCIRFLYLNGLVSFMPSLLSNKEQSNTILQQNQTLRFIVNLFLPSNGAPSPVKLLKLNNNNEKEKKSGR